jgi:hypothetical protein
MPKQRALDAGVRKNEKHAAPEEACRPWTRALVADRRGRFSPTYRERFDFDLSILEDGLVL